MLFDTDIPGPTTKWKSSDKMLEVRKWRACFFSQNTSCVHCAYASSPRISNKSMLKHIYTIHESMIYVWCLELRGRGKKHRKERYAVNEVKVQRLRQRTAVLWFVRVSNLNHVLHRTVRTQSAPPLGRALNIGCICRYVCTCTISLCCRRAFIACMCIV